MGQVIHAAWKELTGDRPEAPPAKVAVADLIAAGESDELEFKSTLRTNLHTSQPDERMHLEVLKTIAGFLNAKGGTLLIGIRDNGDTVGIEVDGFANEDKMGLHLINLVKDRIGAVFLPYIHPHFEDHDAARILSVRCEKGPRPAFVKDGSIERFFVRGGASTPELLGTSITDYVKRRFG
jgi:predicted HTH transcriptional regulator